MGAAGWPSDQQICPLETPRLPEPLPGRPTISGDVCSSGAWAVAPPPRLRVVTPQRWRQEEGLSPAAAHPRALHSPGRGALSSVPPEWPQGGTGREALHVPTGSPSVPRDGASPAHSWKRWTCLAALAVSPQGLAPPLPAVVTPPHTVTAALRGRCCGGGHPVPPQVLQSQGHTDQGLTGRRGRTG